jgi:succinate dehydrogenase / fumarate reductase, cytochrome b subunit
MAAAQLHRVRNFTDMATGRPISPHLQVYKWGPHMLVSILHRASGDGLAIVGSLMFLWWLGAIAGGEASYQAFLACVWQEAADKPLSVWNWLGRAVMIGLTWAFFQHFFSGLRHFVLDTGAGYELKANKLWSLVVILAAIFATAAVWLAIFARQLGGLGA